MFISNILYNGVEFTIDLKYNERMKILVKNADLQYFNNEPYFADFDVKERGLFIPKRSYQLSKIPKHKKWRPSVTITPPVFPKISIRKLLESSEYAKSIVDMVLKNI